jgi:Haem-binding domain
MMRVMRKRKRIFLIGAILLAAIQFVRPHWNKSDMPTPDEIGLKYTTSAEVQGILKHSCYDCHSNNTIYPWYAHIQPVGWWIQSHVSDGKRHLNFSEFGKYTDKKAKKKFEDIEDAATNGWMPLDSYVWLHQDTKLNADQVKALARWAGALKK